MLVNMILNVRTMGKIGEFVSRANGYAYVAFVDGNVELFKSPIPRKRSKRVRKA